MEHRWFEDDKYIAEKEHVSKDLCINCDCTRHHWLDKDSKKHIYVLDGNTQHAEYNHKCSGYNIKTTLF